MTDGEFQAVLHSVKSIIHGCRDVHEAEARIDELIEKNTPRKRKDEVDNQDE